jgi:ribosomal protein S18 acetylase RimI-like enzyme
MQALPKFSLSAYADVLTALQKAGYTHHPVSHMPRAGKTPCVYLRHDIDFSPQAAVPMAECEAQLGLRASYYFLLRGPYNLAAHPHLDALRAIARAGHEVGLHYDLRYFPDAAQGMAHLNSELAFLESLADVPITTACAHEPSRSGEDWFCNSEHLIHPHDPRYAEGLTYISDSCRAWRDEALLACLANPERFPRLLFLTHPASWLDGNEVDRLQYLKRVISPMALRPTAEYFEEQLPIIWAQHAGGQAHDARNPLHRPQKLQPVWLREQDMQAQSAAFVALFESFEGMRWEPSHFLMPLPEKWQLSLAISQGENLVATAINSNKDDWLYVHAFFVAPLQRRSGLGQKMAQLLKERTSERDLKGIRLQVAFSNTAALRFYLSVGFVVQSSDSTLAQLLLQWTAP